MIDRKWTALKITLVYLAIGFLWVFFSDRALELFISPDLVIRASTIKGLVYVLVTGVLIYSLVYFQLKRTTNIEMELYQQNMELQLTQKKLHHMAFHDYLTGLPNRLSLYENFRDYGNKQDARCAVLSIDIDNFKYINDTLGYSTGDELIVAVGKRIDRFFGGKNYILYRIGGGEFSIALHGISSAEQASEVAGKILQLMDEPFFIKDRNIFVTVSIGIALYPEHGRNADEILMNSEIAMYRAKEEGKNRFVVFDMEMVKVINERLELENKLRSALGNGELYLHYQPQLDLKTDRITGFEALLRWRNDELGVVPPDKFISIAESTHQIIPIGEWVLKEACGFLKRLHNMGYSDMTMAVNISIVQLSQDDFVEKVRGVLDMTGLDPRFLELEITESVVIKSFEKISRKLERLRELGVRIAMDDFGKGFSSLSGLQNLRIDTLKIDKIFIDSILVSEERALVENIIMIGKKMGLVVLAEGVETLRQQEYLKRFGCHKMQGYFFSRPLPEEGVISLLQSQGMKMVM